MRKLKPTVLKQSKGLSASCCCEYILTVALINKSTRRSELELQRGLIAFCRRSTSSSAIAVCSKNCATTLVAHQIVQVVIVSHDEEELSTLGGIHQAENLLTDTCSNNREFHQERLATRLTLHLDRERTGIVGEVELICLAAVSHHYIALQCASSIKRQSSLRWCWNVWPCTFRA